jgi:hypothetical protein
MKPGDIAGTTRPDGRRQISIDNLTYLASRLAWLYMTGRWPKEEIDHIDRDKGNDRWENLREATHQQNQLNRDWVDRWGPTRGINWDWKSKSWRLIIAGMYLGYYPRLEDAQAIRDLALWYKAGRFANLPKEQRL